MKQYPLLIATTVTLLAPAAFAQTRLNSVSGPGPTFAAPFNNPAFTNNGTYYPGSGGAYYNPYTNGYSSYPMLPGASPYQAAPYGGNPYGYGAYGMPVPLNNGLFGIRTGAALLNMWRAPSGYYYPWAGLPPGVEYSSTTILYAPQANAAPQQSQPPISTMINDMLKYLDDAKDKGRLADADYQHLKRRAVDLQSKEDTLAVAGGGSMQADDEQSIRRDLDQLGREITMRSHR